MNNQKVKRSLIRIIILLLLVNNTMEGQVGTTSQKTTFADSLSLKNIIEIAVTGHPSVRAAEEALNNADARIALAGTGYYPEVDMTANYSNIGPVTKLTIPDMGTFQLFPENNYSASVNYRQVVYDFGRTRQNVEIENSAKAVGEQALENVKQRLALYAVNNYYTLVFLQAAIVIKDEQIDVLNKHLDYVEKMKSTGSATEYQLLATKVRISAAESQKVDLEASLKAQRASLNSLLGNGQDSDPLVKNELAIDAPFIPQDSLLPYAFHNRDEILMYDRKESLAALRYDLIKLQNKPMVSMIASGGAKNGYVPDLGRIRPNYVIGLGIRIPLFDGNKNRYNLSQAQSAITSIKYESETAKRSVSNEIYEAEAYYFAAGRKIGQSELQLAQAREAYALAETSFKSGTITNLDLLDASTAVSESSLMLLKARIDFAASGYKLKAALGERLY